VISNPCQNIADPIFVTAVAGFENTRAIFVISGMIPATAPHSESVDGSLSAASPTYLNASAISEGLKCSFPCFR